MVPHAETSGAGMTSKSRTNSVHLNNSHHHHSASAPDSILHRALLTGFYYVLGLGNWFFFLFVALKTGSFFDKATEKEENDFAIARDALWNLAKQPVPGFYHEFFKTRNGFQFHYICNQLQPTTGKDLVIFVHGFPNSSMVWRYLLQEPELPTSTATVVAVDLPGCGGSDSMDKYDTQVLEHLSEFIIAAREKYGMDGDSIGNTLVVGHDWGCVIAMRLAAEAPALADRFILSNGPLVELVKANIQRALTSSQMIFKQFKVSPRDNFGCLAKSYQALKPLLTQIAWSGYIFAFQLPALLVKPLGEGGNLSFLRNCYRGEHSQSGDEFIAHESKAANLGPSILECKTETMGGGKYSYTVAERSRSIGSVFWHQTSYYRDGLGLDPWEKSIETIAALYNIDSDLSTSESPSRRRSSSASSSLFNNNIKGCLRAPCTMLWGEKDLALTKPICLDGLGDYLAKESEIILFPDGSHWIQMDRKTRKTLAKIISMFANGNSRQTPSYIANEVREFDSGAVQMVKR